MSGGLLEFGLGQALHVREERLSERADVCSLMYISDIHLRRRRSEHLSQLVMESVQQRHPQVILLGGDLVDSRSELLSLTRLVSRLGERARVLAVGGNHDGWVGIKHVRSAVQEGGGEWIHDGTAAIVHGGRSIVISGPNAPRPCTGDVRILCAHNPRVWKTSQDEGYDLVLAGHLHGCQVVGFEYRDRLYPGAWFYPYCYLSHQRGPTRLVVSRGVSDLVPIRWRCPREVVLCHV